MLHPVLRIHDILVRIRIYGPWLWLMAPDPDQDPDPAIFVIDLQDANKKIIMKKKSFSAHYFLKVHLHHFQWYKVKKKSQNSTN